MSRCPTSLELTRRSLLIGAGIAVAAACSDDAEAPGAGPVPPPTTSRVTGELPADGRVPSPAGLIRTNWSTDPFAQGSYSFMKAGATPEDRANLRRPIDERLFFAGEHVNVHAPATVHGAMASGRRAADDVLAVARNGERIVVVGAGISGLTCAKALHDASMEVVVLEARDRIGGRLDTIHSRGWSIPVERGASWVHDTDASDLDRRLVTAGVAARPWNWDDTMSWDLRTSATAAPGFGDDVATVVDEAVSAADASQDDASTLAAAVSGLAAGASLDPDEVAYFDAVELRTEFGAGADELSARWALQEGSEGDDLLVTGGYVGLAERLTDGPTLRFGRPVDSVSRTQGGVVVGAAEEEFDADRVVVTVPFGVLKSDTIAFDPPLPVGHRRAIERLGMGLLDKFWFRFDRIWWRESAAIWSLHGATDTPFVEWYNLEPLTGQPVLLSLLGASTAREWSARSDDEVTGAALVAWQHFADAGW